MLISANFLNGRIFPSTLEGVDYAVNTFKPKAYLAMAGSDSTEFVLSKVVETLDNY